MTNIDNNNTQEQTVNHNRKQTVNQTMGQLTEKPPIYCGDFNLQDFIISRGKELKNADKIFDWVKTNNLFRGADYLDIYGIKDVYETFIGQYDVIDPSFLSITIDVKNNIRSGKDEEHQIKSFKLPKFSIYKNIGNTFELELKYHARKEPLTLFGDILEDLECKINHYNIHKYLLFNIFRGLEGFENITEREIHTLTSQVYCETHPKNLYQKYGKIKNTFTMQTNLKTVISKEFSNIQNDAGYIFCDVLNNYTYIISMNTPESYIVRDKYDDEHMLKNIPRINREATNNTNNLMLVGYYDKKLYLIKQFDKITAKDALKQYIEAQ